MKLSSAPPILKYGGGLGNSGIAQKKTFFFIEAFPFSPFSSQYWHDPLNLTNYVHGSHYLAIVNNEVEEKEVLYK